MSKLTESCNNRTTLSLFLLLAKLIDLVSRIKTACRQLFSFDVERCHSKTD